MTMINFGNKTTDFVKSPTKTKQYQKEFITKQEEINAFGKYFKRKLQIQKDLEDAKIKLISNDEFSLEEAFGVLASNNELLRDTENILNHQVTSRTIHDLLEAQLDRNELTLEECETYLFCLQEPLIFDVFRSMKVIQPYSQDFQMIMQQKSAQYVKKKSLTMYKGTNQPFGQHVAQTATESLREETVLNNNPSPQDIQQEMLDELVVK